MFLRKIFSYFEPSRESVYITKSNELSIKKRKNLVTKINVSELKFNFNKKGKTKRKSNKNFKNIKIKITSQKNNLFNNNILSKNLGKGQKRISPSPKPIVRYNYNIQKSLIQNNNTPLKEKKISFIDNKILYKRIYNQKDEDKIKIAPVTALFLSLFLYPVWTAPRSVRGACPLSI